MVRSRLAAYRPRTITIGLVALLTAGLLTVAILMTLTQVVVALGFLGPNDDSGVTLAILAVVSGASFASLLGGFLRQRYVTEIVAYTALVLGACGYLVTLTVLVQLDGGIQVSGAVGQVLEPLLYGLGATVTWIPFLAVGYRLGWRVRDLSEADPDARQRPLAMAVQRVRRVAVTYLSPG